MSRTTSSGLTDNVDVMVGLVVFWSPIAFVFAAICQICFVDVIEIVIPFFPSCDLLQGRKTEAKWLKEVNNTIDARMPENKLRSFE